MCWYRQRAICKQAYKEVQVGNDQEKEQSERNSHSSCAIPTRLDLERSSQKAHMLVDNLQFVYKYTRRGWQDPHEKEAHLLIKTTQQENISQAHKKGLVGSTRQKARMFTEKT